MKAFFLIGILGTAIVVSTTAPFQPAKADAPEAVTPVPVTECRGSDYVDDSSVAVLPVPVVAFFVPHADLNEIQEDEIIRQKCGQPVSAYGKEEVNVSRLACIPASLTRIVTLGIWQWCLARVSWDVTPR